MNNNKKILLSPPDCSETELNALIEAFNSGWIAPLGPEVSALEDDLANYINVNSAVALSSGTAGIHLGLILCDVKPNDVVFCSSFTFAASAFPIKYLGAKPVFIDSESNTWNMCPTMLEKALEKYSKENKLPKAVIAVDLYGMPCNWDKISEICNHYKVPIIEDSAEGLGASFKNKQLGSFGKFGVLSFNGNKIITTSGGGALVSNNESLISKARFLATQAREPVPHYEHKEIGYNYRMSNLLASLGRAQLSSLNEKVAKRRLNYETYKKLLGSTRGITFLDEPEGYFSNRWLTCVLFDSEIYSIGTNEKIRLCLEEANIESRPLWKPMHLQPIFKDCEAFTNGVSEDLFSRGLCLPSGSNLAISDIEKVASTILRSL